MAQRARAGGGRFDLSEAARRQRTLLGIVEELQGNDAANTGPEIDLARIRILRPLHRVLYSPVGPFHPDPGRNLGLLPGLAPVAILASEDPSTDRYRFAYATLVRERNRLLEALDLAIEEAKRLRS